MVHVLREAVLLEQLVRWVLELGEGLRRAADVAQDRGALGRAGVGAEGQIKECVVWSAPSTLFLFFLLHIKYVSDLRDISLLRTFLWFEPRVQRCDSHLTDAVRERCSLESITQPT